MQEVYSSCEKNERQERSRRDIFARIGILPVPNRNLRLESTKELRTSFAIALCL
ncbi:MAG TPA: hypothetical protein V6D14_05390 [Coleofasciculaceae cyanobacterium]